MPTTVLTTTNNAKRPDILAIAAALTVVLSAAVLAACGTPAKAAHTQPPPPSLGSPGRPYTTLNGGPDGYGPIGNVAVIHVLVDGKRVPCVIWASSAGHPGGMSCNWPPAR